MAKTNAYQFITFTSPGDCSSCQPHLAGLDSLARREEMIVPHFFVAYLGGTTPEAASRLYEGFVRGPICWDRDGLLWDKYNIGHTPVTALLKDGLIVLLHDAPLASPQDRQQLLDSMRILVPAARLSRGVAEK